jgi:hypothetical protein
MPENQTLSKPSRTEQGRGEGLSSSVLFGWVACSERLPEDFEMVFMRGRDLGCFTGSRRDGKWRVHTPLNAADGRRIMIEDLPSPEYWMPIPSLPNS